MSLGGMILWVMVVQVLQGLMLLGLPLFILMTILIDVKIWVHVVRMMVTQQILHAVFVVAASEG